MNRALKIIGPLVARNVTPLYLTTFGARLYGTETPDSDNDYRGLFLPPKDKLSPDSLFKIIHYSTGADNLRNSKDDIDIDIWPAHRWLKMLRKGNIGALDLLFSIKAGHQEHQISEIFASVMSEYNFVSLFNLRSAEYINYVFGQAEKYGLKGSTYDVTQRILALIAGKTGKLASMIDAITALNADLYIKNISLNEDFFSFAGKSYSLKTPLADVQSGLETIRSKREGRVLLAWQDKEVNWKALSHAMRCLLQIEELIISGDLRYPLKDAPYLRAIKQGAYSWRELKPILETKLEQVNNLVASLQNIPDKKDLKTTHRELLSKLYDAYGAV